MEKTVLWREMCERGECFFLALLEQSVDFED